MSSGSSGADSDGSSTSSDPSGTSVADDTTGKSDETGTPTTDPTGETSSTSGGEQPTTGDPTAGGCGDGVVSPGEQCDGADLQNLDCTSLGLGTGTLGCDPIMCTFDTSMCMNDSGGTSG